MKGHYRKDIKVKPLEVSENKTHKCSESYLMLVQSKEIRIGKKWIAVCARSHKKVVLNYGPCSVFSQGMTMLCVVPAGDFLLNILFIVFIKSAACNQTEETVLNLDFSQQFNISIQTLQRRCKVF